MSAEWNFIEVEEMLHQEGIPSRVDKVQSRTLGDGLRWIIGPRSKRLISYFRDDLSVQIISPAIAVRVANTFEISVENDEIIFNSPAVTMRLDPKGKLSIEAENILEPVRRSFSNPQYIVPKNRKGQPESFMRVVSESHTALGIIIGSKRIIATNEGPVINFLALDISSDNKDYYSVLLPLHLLKKPVRLNHGDKVTIVGALASEEVPSKWAGSQNIFQMRATDISPRAPIAA